VIDVLSLCVRVGRDIRGLTDRGSWRRGRTAPVKSRRGLKGVEDRHENAASRLSVAVIASAMVTSAIALAEPRAVIELFTSQGLLVMPGRPTKLAGELARAIPR